MGNLDQLKGRLVHGGLEFLVALPVAVGLLDDDAALEQQPLQDPGDVEDVVAGVSDPEGDVLEITVKREIPGAVAHFNQSYNFV